jgi:hypothetical protein
VAALPPRPRINLLLYHGVLGARSAWSRLRAREPDAPTRTCRCPDASHVENKGAVRRARKISNAHIFEPLVARDVARHRLLDEILSLFGGRAQPMMAQLAEAGKLTLDDVRELEKTIKKLEQQQKAERKRT